VLVLPGQWAPTRVADCRLRCLPSAPAPLRGRGAYLLYAGAAETSARLQPLDPLADPGRGGEQDDRGLVAGVAQPPADLQPFQARRAGVEQDAVDRGPAQQVEGALAVAGDGDPEALALEERTDTVVIVDDQERLAMRASLTLVGKGRPSPARPQRS
jgi:hypothetical protein